jgi:hypothetical protein
LSLPSPITGLSGITELSPDVFALGGGQYSLRSGNVPGTWEIWIVDLNVMPTPQRLCKIPEIGLLNGMTTWDSGTALAADSEQGKVYKIDIKTGEHVVAVADELMQSPPGSQIPIGINGIKVREGYLYFTVTSRMSFCRVPVDKDCKATGPVEVVASGFLQDDFIFDQDGTPYIVTNPQNTLVKVDVAAKGFATVAGKSDSLELGGGTACAFGRRQEDRRSLYVVTSGAQAMPVNGETEPAKVSVIKI